MNLEEQIVRELRTAVIDDNLSRYQQYFANKDLASIKNPNWRTFVRLLREGGGVDSIGPVLRQIMLDVLANTLAVLGGSSNLESLRGDFQLAYEGSVLPQTLADTLWEQEQESERTKG